MDKAREESDKILKSIENDIGRMYRMHPALISIEKEYAKYMDMVQKLTEGSYRAFIEESDKDIKQEKKEAYMGQIRSYTIESSKYKRLIKKIVKVMAKVNQDALDIVNSQMPNIYTINYNQVATECKRVGIKINGKNKS